VRNRKLFLPPLAAVALYWVSSGWGLDPAGRATAALGVLMASWWVSEALPLPATSLIPVALFPVFGVAPIKSAAAPYAHPLIFLFMGGFMIAAAMERCELHKRLALLVVSRVGARPGRIVAAFMGVTAFLSMWVSNTATALMMLSIATSVIALLLGDGDAGPGARNFATCLVLGIAYAASIGGAATLVGTPPNALLAAFVEQQFGTTLSFAGWLAVGLPFSLVFLPFCWALLTRFVFPLQAESVEDSERLLKAELEGLGPMRPEEYRVLGVFMVVAALWCLRPLLKSWLPALFAGIDDAGIAVMGALTLFLLPDGKGARLLDWRTAKQLPWGILILFGGGLSLASAMSGNGVAAFLGGLFTGLGAVGAFWLVLLVTVLTVLLTELTSNTATTAAFLPIFAAVAAGAGAEPRLLLVPTALGASCAFMMPVATPPNAIVFATGYVTMRQMFKAGLWLNIAAILLITGWCLAAPKVF